MNFSFKEYLNSITKKGANSKMTQEALKILQYIKKNGKRPTAIYLQSDSGDLAQVLEVQSNGGYLIRYEKSMNDPVLHEVLKSGAHRRFQTLDEIIGKIVDSRETGRGFYATPMNLQEYKKFVSNNINL